VPVNNMAPSSQAAAIDAAAASAGADADQTGGASNG